MFAAAALSSKSRYFAGVCRFSNASHGIQLAPFMKMERLFTRNESAPPAVTTSSLRSPILRVTFCPRMSTVKVWNFRSPDPFGHQSGGFSTSSVRCSCVPSSIHAVTSSVQRDRSSAHFCRVRT